MRTLCSGYSAWDEAPDRKFCDVTSVFHDPYIHFVLSLFMCLLGLNMLLYACVVRTALKQMSKVSDPSLQWVEGRGRVEEGRGG